ncbi:hypothetical protein FA13DRAFT_1719113 [Coprinellus micaceus]|uniref:Uncharacterized protein n=1 Tax=Coprinellus micaceus TaxID=71717 RepID=A0A4Y7SC52_COPMI|nr:hypothetical protein FA13DRAFT_1719113 [Coprinellus micaceus]
MHLFEDYGYALKAFVSVEVAAREGVGTDIPNTCCSRPLDRGLISTEAHEWVVVAALLQTRLPGLVLNVRSSLLSDHRHTRIWLLGRGRELGTYSAWALPNLDGNNGSHLEEEGGHGLEPGIPPTAGWWKGESDRRLEVSSGRYAPNLQQDGVADYCPSRPTAPAVGVEILLLGDPTQPNIANWDHFLLKCGNWAETFGMGISATNLGQYEVCIHATPSSLTTYLNKTAKNIPTIGVKFLSDL